nr:MAG TPA: hypothetical protein [Caudoviricetes sp.]
MIPLELAKTPEESRLKRVCHLAEARYWRKVGNRSQKQLALRLARYERQSSRYFLGNDLPF